MHTPGLIYAQFPSRARQLSSSVSLSEVESSASTEEREKAPKAIHEGDSSAVSGSYCELGDGQVMEVLKRELSGYDEQSAESALGLRMDLVLFKGAIEHAARLCRSMVRERSLVCSTD